MPSLIRRLDWQFDGGETWRADPWVDSPSAWFANRLGDDPGTIQVSEPNDVIPANTSTPYSVAVGGNNTGVINFNGDRDWFSVQLVAGQTYNITLTGNGASPLQDTYLYLYNSSGVLIAENDDINYPSNVNSALSFTAGSTGTYYIGAGAYADSLTGTYTVAVSIDTSTPLDAINWEETMTTNTIQVYFATAGQIFNGETALRNWTASEIAAAMSALNTYSTFLPFTFSQIGTSAGAELVLTLADIGALGYFQVGTPYGFFDPTGTGWNATGLQQGGYGYITLIHELGHGFGLAHPHDNGGGSTVMNGVTGPFGSYGSFQLNQGIWTTMSYNDGWPTGPLPQPTSSTLGWQGTPMALDIAMLQQFYGANMSYHTGNDTYTLTNSTTFFSCIWDAGGTDTIAYAGASACNIDLRAATLQYETGGAGWVSYVTGVSSGFTIANGVVIENATGGSGNDNLVGNSANNTLNGGAGADTMAGGAGNDIYIVDNVGDVVTENASEGTDTVQASISYVLGANVENLTLTGSANINGTGNALNNTITGNSGNNILNGGAGADTMIGGAGNDTYIVDNAGDAIGEAGGGGIDEVQASVTYTLSGNIENLTLTGGGAITGYGNVLDNTITGNAAANSLYGFDGNDILDGLGGADTMFGGNGNDSYYVDNAGDLTIEVSALGGIDTVYTSVTRNLNANLENLTLLGVAGITGYGNVLDNVVTGNAGNNFLYGFDGNDTLIGGGGDDVMFGGEGDDHYIVDSASDVTYEASATGGYDTISSSVDRNLNLNIEQLNLTGTAVYAYGNVQNNVLVGNAVANGLYGFDGNDYLDGGAGADQMFGGNGDDTYIVDNASDVTAEVSALGGIDTVVSSVTRNLTAHLENLYLSGSGNIDGAGNSLNNIILGNSGNNTLYGLDGDDTLDGGLGADVLQGGAGADAYVFSSALGGGNIDTINGYNVADDTIYLNNSVFTGMSAGALAASAFVVGAAAADADDRIIYNSATGALYFDADGNGAGAAIQFATLTAGLALTSADFIIIGP